MKIKATIILTQEEYLNEFEIDLLASRASIKDDLKSVIDDNLLFDVESIVIEEL